MNPEEHQKLIREEIRSSNLERNAMAGAQVILGGLIVVIVGGAAIGAGIIWPRTERFRGGGIALVVIGVLMVVVARWIMVRQVRASGHRLARKVAPEHFPDEEE